MKSSLSLLALSEWVWLLSQTFCGCCTNVYVLETILKNNKLEHSLGIIITFAHFLAVSIVGFCINFSINESSWKRLYLKQNRIPLNKLLLYVVLYFSISLCNNLVWSYKISIPIHIIIRSSGIVITMIVGYFFANKTYTRSQVFACIMVAMGAIIGTIPKDNNSVGTRIDLTFAIGLSILLFATILSAFLGLLNESIAKAYGNPWQELLFYSHFLALPLFSIVLPDLISEFKVIFYDDCKLLILNVIEIPSQVKHLAINIITQYICIRSVNILSGKASSLTVAVILMIRKFVSLFLSIFLFGNELSLSIIFGASLVFLGALLYSVSGKSPTEKKVKED